MPPVVPRVKSAGSPQQSQATSFSLLLTSLFACLLLTSLAGCSSLPVNPDSQQRAPSSRHGLTPDSQPLTDQVLTRQSQAVATDLPSAAGQRVAMLVDPLEAYAVRTQLIRRAQHRIELSTYIWGNDLPGRLLMHELRRAAQRGVQVRLLIDDNGITGLDAELQVLARTPNLSVRLFNPFRLRQLKVLEYATGFNRLQRRMHTKSMIVDGQFAIIGGRNVSAEYFRVGASTFFADLDILLQGEPAQPLDHNFNEFWRHPLAVPVTGRWPVVDPQQTQKAELRLQQADRQPLAGFYLQAVRSDTLLDRWLDQQPAKSPPGVLAAGPIHIVADSPEKAARPLSFEQTIGGQIYRHAGRAQHSLDLISPYLVLGRRGTDTLIALQQQGVRVRILTNSLAATDVAAIHPFYARRRKALLEAGVELHEFKPDAASRQIRRWRGRERRARANGSLHAKVMVWDKQLTYIGSMNLDPRSLMINTEIGAMIPGKLMARQFNQFFDEAIGQVAYRVIMTPQGRLNWLETMPSGRQLVHERDPATTLSRRAQARLAGLLPIEGLM